MKEAFIVSGARTPLGKFGGGLMDVSPVDLGAHAMRAALARGNVAPEAVDGYVFGNVVSAGHGQLIARQAAIKAGIPDTIDGYHVNMVCSSAMLATMNAVTHIKAGERDIMVAGGTESMSQSGFLLRPAARWGYKYISGKSEPLIDLLDHDGLTDPLTGERMGDQTERLAAEFGISRADLDEVAFESHRRAAAATDGGKFAGEIAPYEIQGRKGVTVVDRDEGIRPDTTLESLARLRPAFNPDGVITAGNASQLTDGAAALVVASGDAVAAHGLKPIAKVLGHTWAAGPGWRFAAAPIPAVKQLLDQLGMTVDDIDLFENNEAFAVNSVLFHRELGVPYEKLNVNGGAIALGHPIGATGARLIVTLLAALADRGKSLGLATLCHGTGGSTAVVVERVG
ncbi:MAG: thiolase family protein [Ardenticatenales bacterium]|nr:thiolase family protein [Ardenticatenales bacterium]